MSSSANRSWIAACRRRLAAALCVLMLLAGLLPAHAVAKAVASGSGPAIVLVAQADDAAPAVRGAMPCHAAGQCACNVAALPSASVLRTSTLVRPSPFVAAPSQTLRPGTQAPPAEPPRT